LFRFRCPRDPPGFVSAAALLEVGGSFQARAWGWPAAPLLPLTRKARFRLAGLCREGVEPPGPLRKVSVRL